MRIINIIYFTITLLFFTTITFAGDQQALEKRLEYLKDLPELSSIKFDRNHVFLGFNSKPEDLGMIVRAAAAFGNKAYGTSVHVYGCKYDANEHDPSNWILFCSASARDGKVIKSDCP